MISVMEISVALVEPSYPINVGYAARIIKNFGHKKLILVNPKFDMQEARKFASHAVDMLENAEMCTFKGLIKKEDYVVATTAISARMEGNLTRQAVPPWEMINMVNGNKICFVFGRDTTGLTNEEIAKCDLTVRIPASRKYPTLNISHAIAIILYEISKSTLRNKASAPRVSVDRIAANFAELALIAGVQEYKVKIMEEALRRILRRSKPTKRESSLLAGLPRKIRLALENLEIIRVNRLKASPKGESRE
jgi:tRNA/rRNA methyltransferase